MSKYHGFVGFAKSDETAPGVWEEVVKEREYFGDVIKNRTSMQQSGVVNTNIVISNNISIVADEYAFENFCDMRYITYLGKKWQITSVELSRPRIIMNVGGIYNG